MKSIVLFLVCICLLPGCCTITGAVIGGNYDSNSPDFEKLTTNGIRGLKSGDDVTVVMKDGSKQTGEFVALEKASAEKYAETYNVFLGQNSSLQLPRIGDTVTILQSLPVRFQGFDYDVIWLRRADSSVFPYRGDVRFRGQSFSWKTGPGDIPLLSTIVTLTDSIPMESVKDVIVPHRKYGLFTGALVGAAIDAAVVGIIIASRDHAKWDLPQIELPRWY